jgi:hypothetical protein
MPKAFSVVEKDYRLINTGIWVGFTLFALISIYSLLPG